MNPVVLLHLAASVFTMSMASMVVPIKPEHQVALETTYPNNLIVLPKSGQLSLLMTHIRDCSTKCADFVFYSDRIIRLLIEEGSIRRLWLRSHD